MRLFFLLIALLSATGMVFLDRKFGWAMIIILALFIAIGG